MDAADTQKYSTKVSNVESRGAEMKSSTLSETEFAGKIKT
jgi:hypothetical protein